MLCLLHPPAHDQGRLADVYRLGVEESLRDAHSQDPYLPSLEFGEPRLEDLPGLRRDLSRIERCLS